MKMQQIATLINSVTSELTGEIDLLQEDLSNVVSIGKTIVDTDNVDNYVKKLVNHIGKVVFVDRVYQGGVPSVLMDKWEYGSIMEKISSALPEAEESDSWKLTDGETYSPDVFHQPEVSAKFFNNRTTFEIPLSITERQVKESFSNADQLNGFLSMLTTAVDNSMTIKIEALVMRTINNMTAETLNDALAGDYTLSAPKAVNLLAGYNAVTGETLTADTCLTDVDFIRYATYQIGLYSDRLTRISQVFNVSGKERFTPKGDQKVILLSDFSKASQTFLASSTYNAEKVALPKHDSVPFWQGSGTSYAFGDVSKIDVKTSSGAEVSATGILGVIADRQALGVSNLDRRVTTNYNAKGEFYNNFYKCDAGFFNDLDENFVVFFVA